MDHSIPWTWSFDHSTVSIRSCDLVESSGMVEFTVEDKVGNKITSLLSIDSSTFPPAIILEQNSPNPFNAMTTLYFMTTSDFTLQVDIFDLLGRRVKSFNRVIYPAGKHTIVWDAHDDHGQAVASGMYFFKISTATMTETRKMLLLR
jgi:hypothetical protein